MGGCLYQYAGSDLARSLTTMPHLQFGTAYAAHFETEKDKSDNLKRDINIIWPHPMIPIRWMPAERRVLPLCACGCQPGMP
jgi:hypothetical protein